MAQTAARPWDSKPAAGTATQIAASTITAPGSAETAAGGDAAVPLYELQPQISRRWALSPADLSLLAIVCLFFMSYDYKPLFHSDWWGHVSYGRWMLEHRQLPQEDPFVDLAAGVPIVASSWLSQLFMGALSLSGDPEVFAHLFAFVQLATFLLLIAALRSLGLRPGVAILSVSMMWLVNIGRHAVIRPEIFGGLCFAIVMWLVVRSGLIAVTRRSEPVAAPGATLAPIGFGFYLSLFATFAFWANLHGTFVIGLLVLGTGLAGRLWELLCQTRDVAAILGDSRLQRWAWMLQCSGIALLLNPYGMDLLVYTFLFSTNPNLADIVEWYPLKMLSLEGIPMAASWVLAGVLFRHSRKRVSTMDVLLLVGMSVAVCLRVRMIAWYAPLALFVLAPHLADCLTQLRALWRPLFLGLGPVWTWWRGRSFRGTLIAGLMIWVTFAFSPISRPVLGGKVRPERYIFSKDTPLALTRYLREHPPVGTVAAPQWWGDWLVWAGPPDIQLLTTTNTVHVLPSQVWKDYMRIANAAPDFPRLLDRYRVNTLIVNKTLQKRLLEEVELLQGWSVVYEDPTGLIAVRHGSQPATQEVAPEPNTTTELTDDARSRDALPADELPIDDLPADALSVAT